MHPERPEKKKEIKLSEPLTEVGSPWAESPAGISPDFAMASTANFCVCRAQMSIFESNVRKPRCARSAKVTLERQENLAGQTG